MIEKLNIGGAEQMEVRREIAEGHERWLDGTKKNLMEKHPDLVGALGGIPGFMGPQIRAVVKLREGMEEAGRAKLAEMEA